jgi:saccharopine dehydrogenase-like NADP-dependent oxidoreductase
MKELDEEVKAAGIVVFNEIGLDPGIDHLYAVKTIDEVHEKGGKIKQFLSYCTGLPAPEFADNPLGYKFSWSSRGVLLALLNNAGYVEGGKEVYVEGKELMKVAKPYYIKPSYAFVAYPNRNSVPFKEYYNIPEAEVCVRGTLRYQGFPEFIKTFVELGFLETAEKDWLKSDLTWAETTQKAIGAENASEAYVHMLSSYLHLLTLV